MLPANGDAPNAAAGQAEERLAVPIVFRNERRSNPSIGRVPFGRAIRAFNLPLRANLSLSRASPSAFFARQSLLATTLRHPAQNWQTARQPPTILARIGVAAGKSIPAGAQCCLSDVQPRPGVDPLASESKPSDANPPAGSKPVRFLRCPEKSGKVPGNSGYRAVSVPRAGKSEVAGQPQLGAAGSGSATPIRLTLIALRNSRLAPANWRKSDISPSLGKNLAALGAFCSRPRRTPTLQEVRRLPLPSECSDRGSTPFRGPGQIPRE